MKQMWHLPFARRAAAAGASMALVLSGLGPHVAVAANTFNVAAGTESVDTSVQVNAFAPNNLRVNVGDTVTWTQKSTEFHTITFLSGAQMPDFINAGPDGVFINPQAAIPTGGSSYDGTGYANSGLLSKDQSYSLTFTKAGNYTYVCIVHPFMQATVNVVAAGQPSDAPTAVTANGQAQSDRNLATLGVPVINSHSGAMPASDAPAATAGASDQSGVAFVPRFLPSSVVLHAGDTLTWTWGDPATPHTVTFLGGQPAPELITPQPQEGGPPRLMLNPQVLAPAGDPTAYAGGFLNSGFIDPAMMPANQGPATFAVTFTEPGTYNYTCILHEGMNGTVTVLP